MSATVEIDYYGNSASEPAGTNVDANNGGASLIMNRSDDNTTTTTVTTQPPPHGTNYSWPKNLALKVTMTSVTNISNRRVQLNSAIATGLHVFYKANSSYVQPTSGSQPADNATTDDAAPAGYTEVTTSPQVYDAASVATSSAGRNGGFCTILAGIDSLYAGGVSSGTPLPQVGLVYDEA